MSKQTKKSAQKDAVRRAAGIDNKHITKISASSSRPAEASKNPEKSSVKDPQNQSVENTENNIHKISLKSKEAKKAEVKSAEQAKKAQIKSDKKSLDNPDEKPLGEVFLLARPFVALGRYFRDSWRELRQVRWPNRKASWKLTFAVLVYCAILMAFILVLDLIFTFIFETILK